jgi:hypothetical protein
MTRIPDGILDGVAFLYHTKEQAAKNDKFGGTAFVVARHAPHASAVLGQRVSVPFLISNRHVVWDGGASVVRFNKKNGKGQIIDFNPADWTVHSGGDDLAGVCIWRLVDRVRERVTAAACEMLVSEELAKEADFGVGDDVFTVGRFVNHQGRHEIRPVALFGNIYMGLEPIRHPIYAKDQLSYAVALQTRTGFSGSPVIVYRSRQVPGLADLPKGHESGWGVIGVTWGLINDEGGNTTAVNGVVPSWKVVELLEEPALKDAFEAADNAASEDLKDHGGVQLAVVPAKPAPPPRRITPNTKRISIVC